MESRVYICLDGTHRSVDLAEYASAHGKQARAFEGGRRRLNTLAIHAIQAEISEDEIVLIVREPKSKGWEDDMESATHTEGLLTKASRRHRTASFVDLFAELVEVR